MKKLILSFLVFTSIFCFSQNDSIRQNYFTKRINLGLNYDIENSNICFSFSNSVDLEPLIHFEDFNTNFRYKIEFNTNFQKNWGANSYLGYHFPNKVFIKEIGLENKYYNYDESNCNFIHYGISGKKYLDFLQSTLILKLNYQELNNFKNLGLEIGGQKTLISKKLFTEFGIGINSNYETYNIKLQSLIYKNQLGIFVGYDDINHFKFAKIGINYQIVKRSN